MILIIKSLKQKDFQYRQLSSCQNVTDFTSLVFKECKCWAWRGNKDFFTKTDKLRLEFMSYWMNCGIALLAFMDLFILLWSQLKLLRAVISFREQHFPVFLICALYLSLLEHDAL